MCLNRLCLDGLGVSTGKMLQPKFCRTCPTWIKVYAVVLYFLPAFLRGEKLDMSEQGSDTLLLYQVALFPFLTGTCLIACFLPSVMFYSSVSADTFPTIFCFLQGFIFYCVLVAQFVQWHPNVAVSCGLFFCIHLLWTLACSLQRVERRRLVGGVMVEHISELMIFLLPWASFALGVHKQAEFRELAFVMFSPEVFGLVIDAGNRVLLGAIGIFI